MIYKITRPEITAPLFGEWEETIIWSCLQGIMGSIYADDPSAPASAMAMLGNFAFLAGKPNAELTAFKPEECRQTYMILVPGNKDLEHMILHVFGGRAFVISRYAIKKEPDCFDRQYLESIVSSLDKDCDLRLIDEPLYHMCASEPWSSDLVAQFKDYEEYRRLGLGAVILKDNRIVSGASSYSRYRDGIEIEIDTREEYRRRGLACICGARLILECLDRKLYPSWDAHTRASVALAEKLGYHYSHTYTAVEVRGY